MPALDYILSELLVSRHLLEGEERGGALVEEEIGQRPFTETLPDVFFFFLFFNVFCAASTFNVSFLRWTHRFDDAGVYKMTRSAAC